MDKQHAHQLLDQLDAGQFEAFARLLEVTADPAAVSIANAPIDDEPVSEEEARAFAASKEWFKHHPGIPFEEVVAELGFTMEQVRCYKEQERQQAHALLDMLPPEKVNAVRSLLEVMAEPLARSLALAPVEEEEITSETAAALERSRASLARGEGVPHEEILREFGLSQ
jgi:hypothetical protein